MIKESDIVFEAESGKFWILKTKKAHIVMRSGVTHSTSDSAYPPDESGKSLAIARCEYLERRAIALDAQQTLA